MLLKTLALLSLVTGAVCGVSFGWLWLPVGFAGAFVLLAALSVLFLWAVCRPIDLNVPQENDSPFYRHLANVYAEALIQIFRAKVHARGLENTPTDGRFLLVCNHQFAADPGILLHYFKDSRLAFISKKENQSLFVVGRIMHRLLCQPIDRENDRAALKTILRCIDILKEDKASVAVFPEGYTSMDGKLHRFRPGAFKIAQRAKVPIVVCTLNGTRPLIRNALRLKKTDIDLHLVKVIRSEELEGKTAVAISDMVYDLMLSDLGPEFKPED